MDRALSDEMDAHSGFAGLRNRSTLLLVLCALGVGLALRLVGLSNPPFDAHSFRQTQTLYTIEYFHETGIDMLRPKTIYAGYPGVLVLEFPLFQAIAALSYGVFGAHVEIVRSLNILIGFGTAWLLYLITSRAVDRKTGIWAAVIYWLAPLNVLFQRSTLADPMAVFFSLLVFYHLATLLEDGPSDARHGWQQWLICLVAATLAAVLKALYLWPVVLLVGVQFVRGGCRFDYRFRRAGAVLALAGGCFLVWNIHAAHVNGESPFTQGLKPTSLLGISALLDPQFYWNQIVRRPKYWLGALGVILYPIGLLAAWKERNDCGRTRRLVPIILAPPTYLAGFSNINHPHEYYQLSITPFLAVVSANGLRWVLEVWKRNGRAMRAQQMTAVAAGLLVIGAPLTYLCWFRQPSLNPQLRQFQTVCAGKWPPNRAAMLFIAENVNRTGGETPSYLYAARLWGFGMTVKSEAEARRYHEKFAPMFPGLELVVFYGLERPSWLSATAYTLTVADDENRLYAYSSLAIP